MSAENGFLKSNHSHSRILKWAIVIAIIIVLNLFFNYAISLVYSAPQYNNFCPDSQVVNPPATQKECLAVGGQWTQTISPQQSPQASPIALQKTAPAASQTQGYCDASYTCEKNFTQAQNNYDRNIFIILVILGIAALIFGGLFKASDVVSAGLSLGGVLSLVIASARYWSDAANLLRVIILALALAALLWLGLKKFKN